MKQIHPIPVAALVLLSATAMNTRAELSADSILYFGEGSKVSIEVSPGFWVDTPLQVHEGLHVGTAQMDQNIDEPFQLFEQQTRHLSIGPITVIGSDGNTAQLDFSAWAMSWKGNLVALGTGGDNADGDGVAVVHCDSSCNKGEGFTLDYSATLPAGTTALGGLGYRLQLSGTIN